MHFVGYIHNLIKAVLGIGPKPPLLIITGPTASGKTGLSIAVAKELRANSIPCEIVSADSRQVYRGMEIFSGAVSEKEMSHIPHHLIGVLHPSQDVSVNWFKSKARDIISDIHERGAVPIVVGGTGFWIQSLLFKDDYPKVKPNAKLRAKLEQMSTTELFRKLSELDKKRAHSIDPHNRRRLIRAIEIASELGHVPAMNYRPQSDYETLLVYLKPDKMENDQKIAENVTVRFKNGLLAEAERLIGVIPTERFAQFGLAYKFLGEYWDEKITKKKLEKMTVAEEVAYAKRQRTFMNKMLSRFAKNARIENKPSKDLARQLAVWAIRARN